MTLEAARQDDEELSSAALPLPMQIGVADANIFDCPRCGRPQAVGNARCAGCGLRMVGGIPMRKVASFVAAGLLIGLLVAGAAAVAVTALGRSVDRSVATGPSGVTASGGPVASGAPRPLDPTISGAAVSALSQSTTVNGRLLNDVRRLKAALNASRPTGSDIAPILRNLVTTASLGERLAPTVGEWADAASVSERLVRFYASIIRVAEDGLAASIRNNGAYASAARRMLGVLDDIAALDAASRSLAATAGISLPPLTPAG
jgi:hypothetical protein